ncbi:amidohydrolase family protein [Streptomyces inhibens]|uniref:amidohydrolase family protein n=1 Tax=Streptomyces inhibens TaxID=2293571 RepID=UPI001C6DFF7A|nr:amidohydrolase family protein [Streptomyces inhibens]
MTGAHPSADLHVLDLGEATLLPGLIDSHVHLAFDPDSQSKQAMAEEDAHTPLARMRVHAGQQLRAGITTVRDLGDRHHLAVALREHFTAGTEIGPEILAAGPPITRSRGHCWFLGGEADGITAVQTAVKERIARGADVIKIMATGGLISRMGTAPVAVHTRRTSSGNANSPRARQASHRACPRSARDR